MSWLCVVVMICERCNLPSGCWWMLHSPRFPFTLPLSPLNISTHLVLLLASFLKIGRKWTCLGSRQMHGGESLYLLSARCCTKAGKVGGWGQTAASCWLIYCPPSFHFSSSPLPFSTTTPLNSLTLTKKNAHARHCGKVHEMTRCFILFLRYVSFSPPWQANKDPLFLTGVTFPSEYPASPETLVKLSVYDSKDKSQESVSAQLRLCACFHILGGKKNKIPVFSCAKGSRLGSDQKPVSALFMFQMLAT